MFPFSNAAGFVVLTEIPSQACRDGNHAISIFRSSSPRSVVIAHPHETRINKLPEPPSVTVLVPATAGSDARLPAPSAVICRQEAVKVHCDQSAHTLITGRFLPAPAGPFNSSFAGQVRRAGRAAPGASRAPGRRRARSLVEPPSRLTYGAW